MGKATIQTDWNIPAIAAAAGSTDFLIVDGDQLICKDTDQASLDAAIGSYDYLSDIKDNRRTELRADCAGAIVGLFSSSALGSAHTYDCRVEDQGNIRMRQAASKVDVLSKKIWAHDGVEFTREPHTTAQLDQVLLDMEAHVETQQGKLEGLIATVNAVDTGDDAADAITIAAIVW